MPKIHNLGIPPLTREVPPLTRKVPPLVVSRASCFCICCMFFMCFNACLRVFCVFHLFHVLFFHVALLCFHVFNVAFICFMFFMYFRFFMWFSCVACFHVCLSNCAISCSYLQFSLQKRPPQVRFDLPEMQVLKAKVGLVGVIFRRPIQVEN